MWCAAPLQKYCPWGEERLQSGGGKSVPGKVSVAVTEVFAAERKVCFLHWCWGTTQLIADNKHHTLLIGHVPKQQKTAPPLAEAPVAPEGAGGLSLMVG